MIFRGQLHVQLSLFDSYAKIFLGCFGECVVSKRREFTFVEKKKVITGELLKEIMGTLFYCCAAILLGAVLVVAFGMKTSVIGVSMTPELNNGQEVLVDRFLPKLMSPSRFDVVCFYPKGNKNANLYIKRVIGLPGETVGIKGGYVYIDGVRLMEDDSLDIIEDPGLAENEFSLGENEYFVLGDNRNNSEDSRNGNIGDVEKDTIVGKVWFKLKDEDSSFGFVK